MDNKYNDYPITKEDEKHLKETYIGYAVYSCPTSPKEHGVLIERKTEFKDASDLCMEAKKAGKCYFIKGILPNQEEGLIL